MSNLALRRFIEGAFRKEELSLLRAVPSFSAVFDMLTTLDEAEALVEVGTRLLIEMEQNGRFQCDDVHALDIKSRLQMVRSRRQHG